MIDPLPQGVNFHFKKVYALYIFTCQTHKAKKQASFFNFLSIYSHESN